MKFPCKTCGISYQRRRRHPRASIELLCAAFTTLIHAFPFARFKKKKNKNKNKTDIPRGRILTTCGSLLKKKCLHPKNLNLEFIPSFILWKYF